MISCKGSEVKIPRWGFGARISVLCAKNQTTPVKTCNLLVENVFSVVEGKS